MPLSVALEATIARRASSLQTGVRRAMLDSCGRREEIDALPLVVIAARIGYFDGQPLVIVDHGYLVELDDVAQPALKRALHQKVGRHCQRVAVPHEEQLADAAS